MQDHRRSEVVVGLVSIVSVAILIVGILLGKGCSFSPNRQHLTVKLASSGGLDQSSPVVVNGVKRGRVMSIEPSDGSVLAQVEIDNIGDLHSDAHALVTILEVTGGKKLEIFPGNATASFDASKPMPGRAAIDIGGLVTMFGDMSGELVTMLRRLDTISAVITNLMADGTVAENLKSMSADGAILVSDARQWLQEHRGDLSNSIRDLKGALADVRQAINTNEPKLSTALDKLNMRLSDLEGLMSKGNQAIANADSVIVTIGTMLDDVRHNKGLLNAVMYDTTFRKRMDALVNTVDRFVEQARVNGMNVNVGLGHK